MDIKCREETHINRKEMRELFFGENDWRRGNLAVTHPVL